MGFDRLDATLWRDLELGVSLEHVHTPVGPAEIAAADAEFAGAFAAMTALEAGAIANPDEGRQVGHYWLRAPHLAPGDHGSAIERIHAMCRDVAAAVHAGRRFRVAVILGIGGSALGPQLVADALAEPDDKLRLVFLDNTDPDGLARVLGPLDLDETVFVCISKSGGTAETRNALLEAQAACGRAGVDFAERAIAVTGEGSALWGAAEGWLARIPMWDWVGGRTSVTSAVGLLPMYLQGVDADALLAGAAAMDERTRVASVRDNPAARLALLWHVLGEGRGRRAMVVLPYRDRLVLLSRYLQQLVMESLGKEKDLSGAVVHQGLTVYGNKGSTDQHAYVQQLRDGPDDHFVTFVASLDDGYHGGIDVGGGVRAGDYLQGFLLGTRRALAERGHPCFTITLSAVDAFRIGALIALFERAVGLYAARIGINAYHQPGVEAGKRAAEDILAIGRRLRGVLGPEAEPLALLARRADVSDLDAAWHVLTRLAANDDGVVIEPGDSPSADRFRADG